MPKRPEVRPVRRYSTPRYPGAHDPDPLTHPEPVAYPHAPALIAAVAAAGLSAPWAAAFAGDAPDEVGGALALARSGLPHRTSPFGTGQPSRLDAATARLVIDRLFTEAGYRMAADVRYDRDGVATLLTGYDAARKVGYVFGDWNRLDDDAIVSWSDDGMEKAVAALPIQGELAADRTAALALPIADPTRRARLRDIARLHGMLTGKPGERGDWRLKLTADQERRLAEARAKGDGALAVARTLLAERAAELLSLAEARALEARAVRDREFIAVISCFDQRFVFHGGGYITPEKRAELDRIADPVQREQAMRKLLGEQAGVALDALERAVRSYLQWVRSQSP